MAKKKRTKKKPLKKADRALIARIVLALVVIGLILPLLNVLVVQGPDWPSRIGFLFKIQQPYLISGLAILLFAYIGWSKRPLKQKEHAERPVLQAALALLAVLLFLLVLWSHLPFFTALNAGAIRVTDSEILYDSAGLLGVRFQRETTALTTGTRIADTLVLGEIPDSAELVGIASWSGDLGDARVSVLINEHVYDLTSQLFGQTERSLVRFVVPVNGEHLAVGLNTIEFMMDDARPDSFVSVQFARQMYYPTKSRVSQDGESWGSADGKLLVWIRDATGKVAPSEGFPASTVLPGKIQLLLFRLRPFLLFAVAALVFLSILGIRTCIAWLKAAELEAYASILASLLALQGIEIVKNHWHLVSSTVVSAVGKILGIFYGGGVKYIVEGVHCPVISLLDFGVRVCKSSSGVESMGLFTLLALLVILPNWSSIRKGRAALLYIVGLAGAVVVNILRLTLLLLAGVYISPEFSSGMFHTNVGWILFLLYSAVYWFSLLGFIQNKPGKG